MRNLMGRLKPAPTMALLVAVGVVAAVSLTAPSSSAQSRGYRAPRTADGKPNLNGVYQAITEAYWDIEPHSAAPGQILELGASNAVPAGSGIVDAPLPYKPEALAKKKENYANRIKLDPEIKCYLPGVPRATYMPQPFQILQSNSAFFIAYQYDGAVRNVYL